MNSVEAIEGKEFDWFARDGAGSIALFATGGSGPVPELVLQAISRHDAVGDLIPVSGWGSPAVWQSYSSVGLCVYDWNDSTGVYERVAVAAGLLSQAIAHAVSEMPLPVLHGEFASWLEISLEDLESSA